MTRVCTQNRAGCGALLLQKSGDGYRGGQFITDTKTMTDTVTLGFPEAAARLGVSLRVLRRAIRAGRVAAPAQNGATARLSADWLAGVEAAVNENPSALNRTFAQAVPPFARYPGTSAWRKYRTRVRDYYRFLSETSI